MDQSAFRSLLSAPRDPSSSTSKGKALGGPAPKRGWGMKAKDSKAYEKPKEEDEKPTFAPRATHKKILEEGGYKDRAALRRKGGDDEYKPVEKLLEDFERTAKESGAGEEEITKQRAYLGGDAEHSILVKGLDYALLAARKAELAQETENVADDELDELVKGVGEGKKVKAKKGEEAKAEVPSEKLGKGFKSIGQKDAEPGEKKKKKKKKKIVAAPEETSQAVKKETPPSVSNNKASVESIAGPSRSIPAPPPKVEIIVEEEEDIFADAGEYDLNANLPSDDEDEDEVAGAVQGKGKEPSRRSGRSETRSRSRSLERGEPSDGEHRGLRREYRDRSRSRSRDYDRRDTRRRRSPSYSRSRSRSTSRDRYDNRRYSRGDDSYGRRNDYRSPPRRAQGGDQRYDSRRERSYTPEARSDNKRRRYDSPSPPRRSNRDRDSRYRQDSRDRYDSRSPPPRRQATRSPSPIFYSRSPIPARRGQSKSRSVTPPLFANIGPPPLSRSPSPSSSQEGETYRIPKKLAPLKGSAIADVGAFLSFDADASKADAKRAKKAAWRAAQGLGPQEGEGALPGGGGGEGEESEYATKKKEGAERMRANNDYVKIMKKMGEKSGT